MGRYRAFAVFFSLATLGFSPVYIASVDAAPRKAFAATAMILKPSRLLTEASSLGEPIARLEPGLKVDVRRYSTNEDWIEVRTPGGREGWIPVRFTNLSGRRSEDVLMRMATSDDAAESAEKSRTPASSNRALAQADDLSALPAVSTGGAEADGPSDMTEVEDVAASETVASDAPANEPKPDSDARRKVVPTSAAMSSAAAEVESNEAEDAASAPKARPARRMRVQSQAKASASSGSPQAKAMDKAFTGKKPAPVAPAPQLWPWELLIGLDYMQQMTPESMPGFGLRAIGLYAIDERWSWGGGLDYMRASTSETDTAVDVRAEATKTIQRVAPYAAARFRHGPIQVIGSLGLDFQQSSLSTVDIDTGAEIAPGASGLLVNGSEWSTGIGLRVSPAYMFTVSDKMSLGAALSYSLRWELGSGEGNYAGSDTGSMFHAFGIGALLSMGF